ncbi:hypothetical protein [Ornithinibacillus californiensis]|uniref:hypothetical protein n=1 Tax=Ornithinibacillus californiensis TaxID=161536 RepID=UPI00064DD8EE|nr:hypothetical protein [Ornithinibacillus californiensis]
MSLFINNQAHPNLYKNRTSINEPNQTIYQSDYLKDLLAEQSKMNDTFQQTMKNLRITFQKHQYSEAKKWREVNENLDELKKNNEQHEEFEQQTREWITMLERNSQELHRIVEQNGTINQDILSEINRIHSSNDEIMKQLAAFHAANEQVSSKMGELADQQKLMTEQVSAQDNKQDKVLEQLENQEALMEKSYRQLSTLRSILFERTSFVAEKIEESYKLTSSVLYKFLTGTDKPLTLMMNQKSRETNKQE